MLLSLVVRRTTWEPSPRVRTMTKSPSGLGDSLGKLRTSGRYPCRTAGLTAFQLRAVPFSVGPGMFLSWEVPIAPSALD